MSYVVALVFMEALPASRLGQQRLIFTSICYVKMSYKTELCQPLPNIQYQYICSCQLDFIKIIMNICSGYFPLYLTIYNLS
jgi:hypothetical protein